MYGISLLAMVMVGRMSQSPIAGFMSGTSLGLILGVLDGY